MSAELSSDQKRSFFEDGYVQLPGAVPQHLVDQAKRAINSSLALNGLHPGLLDLYRSQSYAPELVRSPAMLELFNGTSLLPLLSSCIGEGQVQPATAAEISLRFPDSASTVDLRPRLGGIVPPSKAHPEGRVENYTALLAVQLSDVPTPDCGNVVVWPGTHRAYEAYFRGHGPRSLLQSMPDVELPAPRQLTGAAGDAVLMHYQTGHAIAPNRSPHVGYTVYFRVRHVRHESLDWLEFIHWETLTDIWIEWPGIRSLSSTGASA